MTYLKIFVLTVICFIWQTKATASTCTLNPTIYSFKFASLNCTIVSDGPVEFNINAFSVPDAALFRSYRKNFRDFNPILLGQNVLIVDLPAGRAMFDTGAFLVSEKLPQFPFFENAGQLMRNLRAARIQPSTIDFVFVTHGHADHVSGIVTEDGRRAFPNAEVFVGLVEHEFWSNPAPTAPGSLIDDSGLGKLNHTKLWNDVLFACVLLTNVCLFGECVAAFARVYQDAVAPYERVGRLHTVDSENEEKASPVEGVRFISTFGHSPGHCAIEVKKDDERMIFVGDAWITAVR
ncbi:Metallo-beta-lactamase [Gracilaria domingensis]|nr:Metallo-beta-lactamase [Gracilaria domingensis]